eukprot:7400057-Alexandrium_andersonii.AAC.1
MSQLARQARALQCPLAKGDWGKGHLSVQAKMRRLVSVFCSVLRPTALMALCDYIGHHRVV